MRVATRRLKEERPYFFLEVLRVAFLAVFFFTAFLAVVFLAVFFAAFFAVFLATFFFVVFFLAAIACCLLLYWGTSELSPLHLTVRVTRPTRNSNLNFSAHLMRFSAKARHDERQSGDPFLCEAQIKISLMRLMMTRTFALGLLFFAFSACELAGKKRPTTVGDDSVLMAFFFSTQYALNSQADREVLSSLSGRVVAATPESTFAQWSKPKNVCQYTVNLGVEVGLRRFLDLGSISVLTPQGAVELVRHPLGSAADGTAYELRQFLGFGDHQLSLEGRGQAGRFTQDFQVPGDLGRAIQVRIGSPSAPAVTLATPEFPQPGEPNYVVVLERGQPHFVDYEAPSGSTYVRLRLSDGSSRDEADITCFGPPNGRIEIPSNALNTFRTGSDGILELDFMHVSLKKDVARVKESIVLSATRHFQGTIFYYDENDIQQRGQMGLIQIR